MKVYELLDKEFKITTIKTAQWVQKKMIDGYSEFNKKIENIKRNQIEFWRWRMQQLNWKFTRGSSTADLVSRKKNQQTQQFILKFSNQRNKMKSNEESLGDLWDTIE